MPGNLTFVPGISPLDFWTNTTVRYFLKGLTMKYGRTQMFFFGSALFFAALDLRRI